MDIKNIFACDALTKIFIFRARVEKFANHFSAAKMKLIEAVWVNFARFFLPLATNIDE